ncbi:hypothetical protein PWT90_02613 [Aphanocladium album]|nr:hypothetical protein PWT90_02613 [Aphanocladium album]
MKAFTSLRSTFNTVTNTGRVPNEIRICLELVQTCHKDLQDLISLRNDHLVLLEAAPSQILERLNTVIDQANRGLAAARCIVEKCRPDASNGNKTPLHSQIEWVWRGSSEFRCQEPLLSRHHAAVLAELNFMRQLTSWAMLEGSAAQMNHNAALLMSSHETNKKDFPEPVFPDAIAETASSADNASLSSARRSPTWASVGRERAASRSAVMSSNHNRDMSLLFND